MFPDSSDLHVVTGAFGFTGQHIARLLLERGLRVRTLTGHPDRPNPFGGEVEVVRFRFDDPSALVESLRGATVLYNTYWVRFGYGGVSYEQAVANTKLLFAAAREAGVARVVHVSITNPDAGSPLPYFRGKAELEQALVSSGLSYAILRPTVLFGRGDILINNIAWLLRRFPAFGVFGSGSYQIQPVSVADLAALAVEMSARRDSVVLDAVGPETYTYDELVRLIRDRIGSRARIMHLPPLLGLAVAKVAGLFLGDVVVTREEIAGLMAGLLVSHDPPTCPTRFSEWLAAHAGELGRGYASELPRRRG